MEFGILNGIMSDSKVIEVVFLPETINFNRKVSDVKIEGDIEEFVNSLINESNYSIIVNSKNPNNQVIKIIIKVEDFDRMINSNNELYDYYDKKELVFGIETIYNQEFRAWVQGYVRQFPDKIRALIIDQ